MTIIFFQVDESNPPFPRPTAHWWFGCPNVPAAFDSLGNVISAVPEHEHGFGHHDSDVSDIGFDAGK